MPSYKAPLRDLDFVLHDVLHADAEPAAEAAGIDRETAQAVMEAAGKLCEEVLAPLNRAGDTEGCRLEDGQVRTPAGFRAAFETVREGGWTALDCDPEWGGQGMPYALFSAVGEMLVSSNMAFNMYQGLTHGAYSAIAAHGTPEQKALYLPRLTSCEWTGTMNLTEPHCGTDLGMMRTRAEPQDDGSYRITGQKIFISAGDHDLAENIIHLVLARAPGGGAGTRGVSLFIVPKFLPDADGNPGARNAVSVGKLEHKMGIHGSATCVMDYDGATGFLLGDLHKGMRAMFTMMNDARLGVGLQGYAVAEVAAQNAVLYAHERLQGRAVGTPANPDGPADPLIVHPDIRRTLMDLRAFTEGARALTLWGATMIDRARSGEETAADEMIGLLTPVIKGFLTDRGFDAAVAAQQVWGGHGYIEENGMSQFVRDARIAMIYEGANGVQALDLVGRKLGAGSGRAIMAFFEEIKTFLKENADNADLADVLGALKAGSKDLQTAAMAFLEGAQKDPEGVLSGATDFLHLFGHVCLGYMWARMALVAQAQLAAGTGDAAFLNAKIVTARHWATRHMPMTAVHLARIRTAGQTVMALPPEAF
ncbi:acyl-CoA dehydrogenase C-terminal domain-containing protein [Phaeovulum vinaykumarii]|uniref:3-methylmercaptopropionyl-CoA dehydrogenase n=1 Tax=Phaeovulum vinaykumarii TaxID=407234 RepID=A0A1N7JZ10_9RHOB|nr:acyl-CoA dehydrogenase C-terminal domain-containing protein [Phaeovulum vinaykumarii]SIS54570.1 hypothetical protein SAMN05421795_101463 [Phaeovulum vinaykumarii]SOB91988.1 hypothetical protein SAMN05878426_101461 [Phaeovulum vinaykumarii]